MKKQIISLVVAGFMLFAGTAGAETKSNGYDQFERMSSYGANLYIDSSVTTEYIMTEALKNVINEDPDLAIKLIKAGFKSLDEYSEYYTEEEYELFKKNLDKIVYGIGVVIQQTGDYVTVMSCMDDGGAIKAGVLAGDKISKVDGVSVKGASVDKVQDLIVGDTGTTVTISFIRDGQEFERTITRQEVRGQTVAGEILKGNIGYIAMINFAERSAEEFAKILGEFDAAGVKNIILDLRNNPGGYLESAVRIAKMIVPEGPIVTTVYRNESENTVEMSAVKNTKYNFCVLINEHTASAAEVLASAMGESGIAHIAGQQSYGKGVIQTMFQMWDGSAFKITTGKYFTRNGFDINGNGIVPHEDIENTKDTIDISKYSTFDYKTKPKAGDISPNVRAAKERLRIMGYYTGSVNEIFDESLENAIYRFQAENGLGAYGVLDIATQVKMENIFYKLEVVNDDQLVYAYEYLGGKEEDLGI